MRGVSTLHRFERTGHALIPHPARCCVPKLLPHADPTRGRGSNIFADGEVRKVVIKGAYEGNESG